MTLGVGLAAACAVAMAAGGGQQATSDIYRVRLGGDASETRIVVDLKRAASGAVDNAADPAKIGVVLKGVLAAGPLEGQGRGLVRDWAIASGPGGARLTLDLSRRASIERRFLLPPADGVTVYRYVIDIAAADAKPHPAAIQLSQSLAPDNDDAPIASPAAAPHARKVIVLDPGHGGKDPGAEGASSYEKNVTLATALAVKARLEATGRYQVVMTRDSDVFVPLEQRVQIARRAGADLFLSLHADSGPDAATRGATVYTLSAKGETRVGYVLSRHEWFLQPTANGDDRAVGQILLDLTQRTTRNRSAIFAQDLIERVGDSAPLTTRSQRDANYFVLLAPDVPAALLEMGFITNPDDEARLNDPTERAALADKIVESIDAYFSPPTKLAAR
ncbi:MAG TPA: N-acetylmuramoyl-L-alanine amidase [Caulobacteraceae bacterium]|nr:N-acetylmuramoyl-L-alanine amidase [Caulobacteraceae bacterium]